MKFVLFALLFSTFAMASEIQTTLSESGDGLSFSLYEISYPGEEAPLWFFASSLSEKELTTSDKNFSFRCKQSQVTKSVFETRCSGVLKDSTSPGAYGNFGTDFVQITLIGKSAEEFYTILPKQQDMVSLIVQKKLVIMGNNHNLGIIVRH